MKPLKNFPKEEIYGITNQIRRASYSIPANIAEGRKKEKPRNIKISFSFPFGRLIGRSKNIF